MKIVQSIHCLYLLPTSSTYYLSFIPVERSHSFDVIHILRCESCPRSRTNVWYNTFRASLLIRCLVALAATLQEVGTSKQGLKDTEGGGTGVMAIWLSLPVDQELEGNEEGYWSIQIDLLTELSHVIFESETRMGQSSVK